LEEGGRGMEENKKVYSTLMSWDAVVGFLEDTKILWLVLHLLATAIGLGGATVSDILFFKFLKDYKISKKEVEVLHTLKDLILGVMAVIVLTGAALFIPRMNELASSAPFILKVTATAVLVANGIALHAFIAPHLIHLNFVNNRRMGREWHRLAFALGSISVCSWYSVFLIAMLKQYMTEWPLSVMLSGYVLIVVTAVVCSQIVEERVNALARK
jgi:hypothetical protein